MNPKKPRRNCKQCGLECPRTESIYCTNKCQLHFQNGIKIQSGTASDKTLRTFLLQTIPECSICKIKYWNDKPITLELDHIDGNHSNNILNNVRLLCPNCHSQTSTYKSKNRGNGRQKRRQRYLQGKSW